MEEFSLWVGVFVFVAYAATDALYARYTISVTALREWNAAAIGVLVHLFLAFGVIQYTENYWYTVPLAMGSWTGTFFAVRWERKRLKGENRDLN